MAASAICPALARVRTSLLIVRILAAVLLVGSLAIAQETRRLKMKVYSVSGEFIFFQEGRSAGLRTGDLITLRPRGAATVLVVVKEVSKNHCRARLLDKSAVVDLGTPATVDLPLNRVESTTKTTKSKSQAPKRSTPDHPPWTMKLDGGQEGLPLLAPIRSRSPEGRPVRIHGRAWFNTDHNTSKIGGTNRFFLMDVGTDSTVENLFGSGGELRFRGDYFRRQSDLARGGDRDDREFRLDRLSYRQGFTSDLDLRWQVGRFLPEFTPEFGVLDGVHVDYRMGRGDSRLALAVGGRPDPVTIKGHAEDYQTSVYYHFNPTSDRSFELGAGYMKSFHDGKADRDLLLFKGFYRPASILSFHTSLWLDYYSASEQAKSQGFEVTQFQINGNWTVNRDNGASLYVDYFRIPEIGRPEFLPVETSSLLDHYTLRATLSTWHRLSNTVRLDFRATPWQDEEKDGINAEGRVTLTDLLYDHGALALTLFQTQGVSNDGVGARLALSGYTIETNWRIGYEVAQYDYDPQLIADDKSTLQALTGNLDWNIFVATDVLFNFDYRFGDNLDAMSFGLYIQTRF